MIKRVFIANRGEIALRIIRACQELDITSVLGYSEADKESLPTKLSDEKICIGPANPIDSYLNIPSVISAIELKDCDAVHPGYGFLSENPFFVEICDKSGINFIGPSPENLKLMGDKSMARNVIQRHRLPIIPGYDNISDHKKALHYAEKLEFPVILKASGGGGGRGMRIISNEKEFENLWNLCQQEAKSAFDNPSLYIEKYIERPRHIEIQVIVDKKGKALLFPERDCSLQRRHQKLIEESPSPIVDASLRRKFQKISKKICRVINYSNVGTIEYLFDGISHPYFMEMNTRIQVEHSVTEVISGIDIVKEQIKIASGENLKYPFCFVPFSGHSIECRINAENTKKNFMPSPGKINRLILPGGPGIRVDTHIYEGYTIPPYYDSLIAKLISFGSTREESIARMQRALKEFVIEGVYTTIDLYKRIFEHPIFLSGRYYIGWLEKFIEGEENGKR
jgi:acetyl-CoA carboxylase biotin carboxylase subunit